MDRGGWQAIVRGVARVGHDCVTEHTHSPGTLFFHVVCTKVRSMPSVSGGILVLVYIRLKDEQV